MKAAGELARLTYDTRETVKAGDYVITSTGRAYLVTAARLVDRQTPTDVNRYALSTVVMADAHPIDADEDVIHRLAWYRR